MNPASHAHARSHSHPRPHPLARSLTRLALATALLLATTTLIPTTKATADPAASNAGMVATAHTLASQAGANMLQNGGNAVDAAVASAFVLAVVEPHSSGLGGGGFLMLHLTASELEKARAKPTVAHTSTSFEKGSGATVFIDFREAAPSSTTPEQYLIDGKPDPQKSLVGGLAIGIPSQVAGLYHAHSKYGRLAWAAVLAPAIAAARDGFATYPTLRARITSQRAMLEKSPLASRIFLPAQNPPPIGAKIVQPELADTLTRIANEGPRGIYQGPIGDAMVATIAKAGATLTAWDIADYKVIEREPLAFTYRDTLVLAAPPPSSGGVALAQILGMLGTKPVTAAPNPRTVEETHRLVEAMRLAFADRAQWLGDPAFFDVPLVGLTDPAYIAKRAALINDKRALPFAKLTAGTPTGATPPQTLKAPAKGAAPDYRDDDATKNEADAAGNKNTTHLSVIDANGNAVALTTSINYTFGSGVFVEPMGGFFLNNTIDDFAIAPGTPNAYGLIGGTANAVAANKRPLSSMSPTLLMRDGTIVAALGSPGGSTIITSVAQTIIQLVDRKLDVRLAVDAPRIHHQFSPDRLFAEEGSLGAADADALKRMGHTIEFRNGPGDVQAVTFDPETRAFFGASDHRRNGAAIGVTR